MKVTLTIQQLKKLRKIPDEDFDVFEELVRHHGIIEVSDADKPRLMGLKGFRLLKMRSGKAWLPVEVNGVKSTPFLGHRERGSSSSGEVAKEFHKAFKIIHTGYYGDFDKRDWTTCSRMAKEFDTDELGAMLSIYMRSTAFGKISLLDFYKNRNKIYRKLGDNYVESKERREEDNETDGGW